MRQLEEGGDDALDTRDVSRQLDKQVRHYIGRLDHDDWDALDFEEEFETFERFTQKRKGKGKGR